MERQSNAAHLNLFMLFFNEKAQLNSQHVKYLKNFSSQSLKLTKTPKKKLAHMKKTTL
jgi:predicted GTPase